MPDIFNRTASQYGGSFAADQATMSFSELGNGVGQLVQNVQIGYQQAITKLYELGSPRVYLVGGRTNGQGSMGRIIGPARVQSAFYRTYGDICSVQGHSFAFNFTGGCGGAGGGGGGHYTFGLPVINSVSISVAAQDMLINEQVGFMFSTLDIG